MDHLETHSDLVGNDGKAPAPEVALVLTSDDADGTLRSSSTGSTSKAAGAKSSSR